MKKRNINLILITGGLLFAFFVLSLVLFLLLESQSVKRVLFFPNDVSGELNGEVRKLPRSEDDEENIQLFVKEIMLGPAKFVNKPIIPRDADLQSIILRDNKLYIDFGDNVLSLKKREGINFEKIASVLKQAIKFNFPYIDTIYITINGQTPQTGGVLKNG